MNKTAKDAKILSIILDDYKHRIKKLETNLFNLEEMVLDLNKRLTKLEKKKL